MESPEGLAARNVADLGPAIQQLQQDVAENPSALDGFFKMAGSLATPTALALFSLNAVKVPLEVVQSSLVRVFGQLAGRRALATAVQSGIAGATSFTGYEAAQQLGEAGAQARETGALPSPTEYAKAIGKSAVTGGALGLTGGITNQFVQKAATLGAFSVVPPLLEGRTPTLTDIFNGGLLLGAFGLAHVFPQAVQEALGKTREARTPSEQSTVDQIEQEIRSPSPRNRYLTPAVAEEVARAINKVNADEYIVQSQDGRYGKLAITKQGNPVWQPITNPRTVRGSMQERQGRYIFQPIPADEFDALFPRQPEGYEPGIVAQARQRFLTDEKIPLQRPRSAPGKVVAPVSPEPGVSPPPPEGGIPAPGQMPEPPPAPPAAPPVAPQPPGEPPTPSPAPEVPPAGQPAPGAVPPAPPPAGTPVLDEPTYQKVRSFVEGGGRVSIPTFRMNRDLKLTTDQAQAAFERLKQEGVIEQTPEGWRGIKKAVILPENLQTFLGTLRDGGVDEGTVGELERVLKMGTEQKAIDDIEAHFARGMDEREIYTRLPKVPPDDRATLVRAVQEALGIPNREEDPDAFEQWVMDYRRRQTAVPGTPEGDLYARSVEAVKNRGTEQIDTKLLRKNIPELTTFKQASDILHQLEANGVIELAPGGGWQLRGALAPPEAPAAPPPPAAGAPEVPPPTPEAPATSPATGTLDQSLAPILNKVWAAGYKTLFSDSGLDADHPQRDPSVRAIEPGYLTFADESQRQAILRAAKSIGARIEEGPPGLTVRMPHENNDPTRLQNWNRFVETLTNPPPQPAEPKVRPAPRRRTTEPGTPETVGIDSTIQQQPPQGKKLGGVAFTPGTQDAPVIAEMEQTANSAIGGEAGKTFDETGRFVTATKTAKPDWMRIGDTSEYYGTGDVLEVLRSLRSGKWPTSSKRERIAEQIMEALRFDAEEEKARLAGWEAQANEPTRGPAWEADADARFRELEGEIDRLAQEEGPPEPGALGAEPIQGRGTTPESVQQLLMHDPASPEFQQALRAAAIPDVKRAFEQVRDVPADRARATALGQELLRRARATQTVLFTTQREMPRGRAAPGRPQAEDLGPLFRRGGGGQQGRLFAEPVEGGGKAIDWDLIRRIRRQGGPSGTRSTRSDGNARASPRSRSSASPSSGRPPAGDPARSRRNCGPPAHT